MQVVDEADRLLRQAYNEWLPVLNDALSKNSEASGAHAAGGTGGGSGALTGQFVALARSMPSTKRLVKVLVSATLTKDPTKLAKMDLKFPRYGVFNPSQFVNCCAHRQVAPVPALGILLLPDRRVLLYVYHICMLGTVEKSTRGQAACHVQVHFSRHTTPCSGSPRRACRTTCATRRRRSSTQKEEEKEEK